MAAPRAFLRSPFFFRKAAFLASSSSVFLALDLFGSESFCTHLVLSWIKQLRLQLFCNLSLFTVRVVSYMAGCSIRENPWKVRAYCSRILMHHLLKLRHADCVTERPKPSARLAFHTRLHMDELVTEHYRRIFSGTTTDNLRSRDVNALRFILLKLAMILRSTPQNGGQLNRVGCR